MLSPWDCNPSKLEMPVVLVGVGCYRYPHMMRKQLTTGLLISPDVILQQKRQSLCLGG